MVSNLIVWCMRAIIVLLIIIIAIGTFIPTKNKDKIEIVCERLGGTSIEFNGINMPSKEFIRKVENLIPAVEKFSKQLF